ncbi:ATP-dependent DNA helicase [Frankliniella fusca]|uniref:ATP-dependent DNA helicase n=1 Tax=Frankliniella fusca TaxID=407009 RepID=A0AAE1I3G3_9NEOP|nr:ATP-dependent DNA helicase [Frankliniella fusca]
MDPLQVPEELKCLTFIENQLISRIHPVISLYRVKKLQYKYTGQVINFTQDVQNVADSLPHLLKDLSNVVVVKLNEEIHLKDFVVRKQKVLNALIWLKNNNPQYSDIHIDTLSLDELPTDSNVYEQLKSIENQAQLPDEKDNESKSHDDNSIPGDVDDITYTSVQDSTDISLSKTFSTELVWPTLGTTPINEFSSPGYISMAFPHLFCYGTADYSMPRKQKVPLNEYIRHLMLYHDERFAKDERFRYFIMNTEMRWTSLNIGNVYVQKNSMFSKMTIYQLKQYFKENPWIVNQIMHFGSRLRTTKPYWQSRCGELLDMVDQIVTDIDADLAHLVNQVQRHTKCSETHCLRRIHKDKTLKCGYNFPKPLLPETNFEIIDNTIVDINFKRNDTFVNKYNSWVLQTWRSNIDFSPVLSKQIVYRYIAKYASKSEVKSKNYNEVLTNIVNKTCDDSEPILFYPWRSLDDVNEVNTEMKNYISISYKKYIHHDNEATLPDNEENDQSDFDVNPNEEPEKDNETILSRYLPKVNNELYEKATVSTNIQWDYLSKLLSRQTIHTVCEMLQVNLTHKSFEKLDYSTLNTEQLTFFNHIKRLTCQLQKNVKTGYQFIIVQGMAGTGVSAKIVNGTTLHSFLSISRFHKNSDRLKGTELLNFREKHTGVKFIFIDEYSMVGLRFLACIETRCKDITGVDELFGGLIVVLFGDVNQLLPIGDQPLYANVDLISQRNNLLEKGKILMTELTHAYVLKRCHRFANKEYVTFLQKVSKGKCSDHEFQMMKQRYIYYLPSADRKKFKSTTRICSTNETANDFNVKQLKKLETPIAVIHAQNNNKTAFNSTDDIADGLSNILSIAVGAKVMLRRNINVTRGLVNGSIGILKHIFYEKDCKPPTVPLCVLIQFENVDTKDLNITYIPILPVLSQWYKNGISCSRYQLPISLCWACTIHKSQGLTLVAMALDAGKSEFALGLLYVALSRVPDKESLCLITMLTIDRLNSCDSRKDSLSYEEKKQIDE